MSKIIWLNINIFNISTSVQFKSEKYQDDINDVFTIKTKVTLIF